MYTRSMETIYLSLVHTGSWGTFFMKSPVPYNFWKNQEVKVFTYDSCWYKFIYILDVIKVLDELIGMKSKHCSAALIVDHLGLSLVKAFCILSYDWPRVQRNNECGIRCQLIFLLLIPKKHQLLSKIIKGTLSSQG